MRSLRRNQKSFFYSPYQGNVDIKDEYGNKTGEHKFVYGKPIKVRGVISGARGNAQEEQFGKELDYDKVILLDTVDSPINEYSILWVDCEPLIDSNGNLVKDTDVITPHDYVVKKIAKTLNNTSIAITKVKVNG